MDNGQKVITTYIAHPEHSSGELKIKPHFGMFGVDKYLQKFQVHVQKGQESCEKIMHFSSVTSYRYWEI